MPAEDVFGSIRNIAVPGKVPFVNRPFPMARRGAFAADVMRITEPPA
jgi:hypothetical protein